MKGEWEGIAGEWITDPTAIDGQRFVAAAHAIHELRWRMRVFARNRCEFCSNFAYCGDRHHIFGRGFGGGKKEDRPVVLGVRFVVWTCRICHEEQTIKPWGSWLSVTESRGYVDEASLPRYNSRVDGHVTHAYDGPNKQQPNDVERQG